MPVQQHQRQEHHHQQDQQQQRRQPWAHAAAASVAEVARTHHRLSAAAAAAAATGSLGVGGGSGGGIGGAPPSPPSLSTADYQALARWVEHLLPFGALMAVVFAYHFLTPLFLCAWLGCSVHKANKLVRKIVASTDADPLELAAQIIFVSANVALTVWLAGGHQLRALVLLPPRAPMTALEAAFSVATTDSLVRCFGFIVKLLIAAATMLPRRGRGGGAGGGFGGFGEHASSLARRASLDGGAGGAGVPLRSTRSCGLAGAAGRAGCGHSSGLGGRASLELPSVGEIAPPSAAADGCCGSGGGGNSGGEDSGSADDVAGASGSGSGSTTGSLVGQASCVRRHLSSAEVAAGLCGSSSGGRVRRAATYPPPPLATAASAPLPSAALPSPLQPWPSGRVPLAPGSPPPGASYAAVCARRRGRLLALYDGAQAGYRALLPAPVWAAYLRAATPSPGLNALLVAAYLSVKAYGLARRGQLLLLATRLVLRTGALYGRYLTKGELTSAGGPPECPICQDAASAPIRLDCKHTFCEDCLASWLEQSTSCPMCRSCVKPPGMALGDGSTTLLPQLF